MSDARKKLEALLELLERVDDAEAQRSTITGLACARGRSELHVAIGSGVVAIPYDQIEDVTAVSIDNPRQVAVKVKRADAVRLVRRPPALASAELGLGLRQAPVSLGASLKALRSSDDIEWPPILGPGVSTQYCVTTVTDGNACDDFECESVADDLGQ
ncbi:MAG: hypothetical protein OXT09_02340 [Myxococcales bacterium]|nr:hypothetical protein [Myxococcales bacterium]